MRFLRPKLVTVGFGLALMILIGVSWMEFRTTQRLLETSRWRDQTEEVIGESRALLVRMTDTETGERGFVITGDERFLEPYNRALGKVPDHLARLRFLTADNPAQQHRLDLLGPVTRDKMAHVSQVIEIRRDKGFQAAASHVAAGQGKIVMDRIRSLLDEMEAEENRLRLDRDLAVKASAFRMNLMLFAGAAASILLFVVVFAALSREIRERRRLEEARAASETRLQAILDHSPASIYLKDLEGRFLIVNRQVEIILRRTAKEIVGKTSFDFIPKPSADSLRANDRLVLEAGTPLTLEETVPVHDGLRTYLLTRFPLRDARGAVYALGAISTDITERKAAQEQVVKMNEALKLHGTQLEVANKELEAFSYSVSHDLRAPLRHISGFADLLREHAASTLDDKGQRYLETIATSARRMGELIDDLLVFSRMGRNEMRRSRVPLSPMVAGVVREMESEVKGRTIEWAVAPLPEVEADPAMMRLVFTNLISNAIKYTQPRPEARIEIGASNGGGEIVVFVRDNGVGFDMRYAHKLFGVFQRLHRKEEFEGTGIGLANVRRIIHRHGGRTWAEGEMGHGAAFYFSLPKQQESAS